MNMHIAFNEYSLNALRTFIDAQAISMIDTVPADIYPNSSHQKTRSVDIGRR
jgi:hypothetical protein